MDIAGAKALKQRLAAGGAAEAPAAAPTADVPEDAPPVYHYLGVTETPLESPAALDDAPGDGMRSLLSRLRLSFR